MPRADWCQYLENGKSDGRPAKLNKQWSFTTLHLVITVSWTTYFTRWRLAATRSILRGLAWQNRCRTGRQSYQWRSRLSPLWACQADTEKLVRSGACDAYKVPVSAVEYGRWCIPLKDWTLYVNDISADVSNVTVTTGKTNPLTLADNFSDAEGTIYAKDLDQSEVLFNRKNGVATISFPLQDGRTMLKKWRCDTGPDITK